MIYRMLINIFDKKFKDQLVLVGEWLNKKPQMHRL